MFIRHVSKKWPKIAKNGQSEKNMAAKQITLKLWLLFFTMASDIFLEFALSAAGGPMQAPVLYRGWVGGLLSGTLFWPELARARVELKQANVRTDARVQRQARGNNT